MANDISKISERRSHLMQLGFTLEEVAYKRLCFDDALWEQAKDLPINPDSEECRLIRLCKELDRQWEKLTPEEKQEVRAELWKELSPEQQEKLRREGLGPTR